MTHRYRVMAVRGGMRTVVELRFELRLSRLTLPSSRLLLKVLSSTLRVIASRVKMRKPISMMPVVTICVCRKSLRWLEFVSLSNFPACRAPPSSSSTLHVDQHMRVYATPNWPIDFRLAYRLTAKLTVTSSVNLLTLMDGLGARPNVVAFAAIDRPNSIRCASLRSCICAANS